MTTTVRITDRRTTARNQTIAGKYNGTIAQFSLKKEMNDENESYETLFIKYGTHKNLEPCSVYHDGSSRDHVYVSAFTGKFGDIRIELTEFIKILKKLNSVILLQEWSADKIESHA